MAGDNGFRVTELGPAFAKAYSLTLYRPKYSSVAYVVEVSEAEPGTVVADITDPRGAESTVTKYFEAERDNDYEAWASTRMYKGLWGGSGVIILSVDEVRVAVQETYRIREMYLGSDLAKSRGWSDERISKNMITVFAQYTVDYDNTKVPFREGVLTQYLYLTREDPEALWLIWDAMSSSDIPSS